MLELQWCPFDMVFHACFECSVVAVPFEVNSNASRASPVSFDWMVLLEGGNQMFCILFSLMTDPKVINNKGEGHRPCLVEEEPWSVF